METRDWRGMQFTSSDNSTGLHPWSTAVLTSDGSRTHVFCSLDKWRGQSDHGGVRLTNCEVGHREETWWNPPSIHSYPSQSVLLRRAAVPTRWYISPSLRNLGKPTDGFEKPSVSQVRNASLHFFLGISKPPIWSTFSWSDVFFSFGPS